jgi:CheY-like chemotaxis protein/HPt (histidine-containing phosphotransfer) domain-containing protein
MIQMLRGWGCSAEEAMNGPDALARMRRAAADGGPYRVAVIDHQTSGMNGEELGASVRSYKALEETKTVLITGGGKKGDATRVQSLGFSGYLTKPVGSTELHDAVVQVIRNAAAAKTGAKPPLVTRHSLAEARRGRVRILLVEDNPVNKLVTEWALRRQGYTLDAVKNGRLALEACERRRYDLVLMDLQMPDMDGFEAVRELRAREPAGARMPVVAMTASDALATRESCRSAGMDDCLMKPVDLSVLSQTVERWTRAKQLERPEDAHAAAAKEAAMHLASAGAPPAGVTSAERPAASGAAASERPVTGGSTAPSAAKIVPFASSVSAGAEAATSAATTSSEPLAMDFKRLAESSMGIPSLREALLRTFLSDVHPRLDRLGEAVEAGDAQGVEFEAHGLRGMAATIGADASVAVLAELERIASEGELVILVARDLVERARFEVERAQRLIEEQEGLRKAA